jgi:DNA-directed RNA polymerase sigma subunit (sigma70/sigma32)
MQEKINSAIDKLDAREADIIRTYFGLNESHESRNFAQIAERMGLSRKGSPNPERSLEENPA